MRNCSPKYENYSKLEVACFISTDPLQFKYPYYTPYQYAGNKPISFIDLDGAEENQNVDMHLYKWEGRLTTFVFDASGNYTGKTIVSKGHYKKSFRGIQQDKEGNTTLSFVLDIGQIYENGKLMIKTQKEINILKEENLTNEEWTSKIRILPNKELYGYITESGVYEKNAQENPVDYILKEQKSGKMDAKFHTGFMWDEPNTIFVIKDDKGAYYGENMSNFGNFLFAAESAALGFWLYEIKGGGMINNLFEHMAFDSLDDQNSLERGFNWYFKVLSKISNLEPTLPDTNKSVDNSEIIKGAIDYFLK